MSIKVKTERFKQLVSAVSKGAVCNKLVPITSLIGICVNEGVMTLYAFDKSNYVIGTFKCETEDTFDVSVDANTFSKLVSKITSDVIELSIDDNTLKVTGNGSYVLPLVADDSGIVAFPKPTLLSKENNVTEITTETINNIISINKSALSKSLVEHPYATGYLMDSTCVTTTDATVVCFNNVSFIDDKTLISSPMMELLTMFNNDKVNFVKDGTNLMFWDDTLCVLGKTLDGVELYPDLSAFNTMEYPNSCVVSKQDISDALDRLSLFVDPFYMNSAYLEFGEHSVTVKSRNGSLDEVVPYAEGTIEEEYTCCINIPVLKTEIDTTPGDVIEFNFGVGNAIKLKSDTFSKIIALVDDE